jgi:SAM-dependent methyltransferase
MDWMHGYHAKGGYTYGVYPETWPQRLRWAALLQGHLTPETGFRYLDAGCGQGFNLVLAAAAHPDSEFVGIDFMPEHVAHARRLIDEAGLQNVKVLEGDFQSLCTQTAHHPALASGFDYAVCHGISTWVAPEVRSALFQMLSAVLRPGGLFYNSYNTMPGWLAMSPFQQWVLLEQEHQSGVGAIKSAQQVFKQLQEASPTLFKSQPVLKQRLDAMAQQDPAYLVQEYNNLDWCPLFFHQMQRHMSAVKLDYLGTATLPEVFEDSLPAAVKSLLAAQPDLVQREQLKDYAIHQSFRRDLYVKGKRAPWKMEEQQLKLAQRVVVNPLATRPSQGEPFVFKGGALEVQGKHELYAGLLDKLTQAEGGSPLHDLLNKKGDQERAQLLRAISQLVHGGWVSLSRSSEVDNSAAKSAQRLNDVVARMASAGAPYRYITLPRCGTPMAMSEIDMILWSGCAAGHDRQSLAEHLGARLAELGRALAKQGQAVTDPAQRAEMIQAEVERFLNHKRPYLLAEGACSS